MAEITRKRTGELLRIVFEQLLDKPDGLPAKVILGSIPQTTTLTEYESGYYPSAPGSPRYERIVRFATISCVKAGWLIKEKGLWYITEEGRGAYQKFTDSGDFYSEANRLYNEWKRSRPQQDKEDEDDIEEEALKVSLTYEEAEESAWDQIQNHIQAMNPYGFQDLVADLLEAMGYHVSWVSPPGKDRGIDIIAYTDPLGASNPRIKVQVKRREPKTSVDGLRAFMSVLGNDDLGLFVCSGGFTSDAKEEARTQESRKVTLLDLLDLIELWIEHYDKLTQEARQRLPIKPIYFMAPEA